MGSISGEDSSGPPSAASSPKSRVKFLCSFGGKIMPRPADGHLKYVGGETRVVAVPRNINFSELMKKINALFDGDLVLKYQVMPEDLDALVSVRSNEDLKHMLDEYERQEREGIPKFRTFLFPSNPVVTENIHVSTMDHPAVIEQRYIDAINGIARSISNLKLPHINANRPSFSISAASSPNSNSPDGNVIDSITPSEPASINGYHNNNRFHIHKVHSSPSLCSLNNFQQQSSSNTISNQHYHHHHQHHHHQNLQQQYPHLYQSFRPPQDSHRVGRGNERLVTALSLGRQDLSNSRGGIGHGISQYHKTSSRTNISCGKCNRCGYYDEYCSIYGCRTNRGDSLPQSPRGNNWE
ncbi:Octicosapeptide/Phox/Bem1p family protein putative isoform 1 [Tripterygium wilfordii]|uniref:Octicosapeptide/Phox/Bem1p family protein putative isoform 1 n=1 Tax=Tripterygium wilfordii TaxID=458696 RepID=A0A7J7CGK9_TRIWF|nr:uncharacterized protein LOC119982990 [Tripterygium wilfordii]KAF5733171.1 Octicosapeptide/Phox/Bem1p family protein putative isoform 1 [Tripterygium wilfordii]